MTNREKLDEMKSAIDEKLDEMKSAIDDLKDAWYTEGLKDGAALGQRAVANLALQKYDKHNGFVEMLAFLEMSKRGETKSS